MKWTRTDVGLPTDRRTIRWRTTAGISTRDAVGGLQLLWSHCATHEPDGNLDGWTPAVIADVMGWGPDDAERVVSAMIWTDDEGDADGWLERTETGYRLLRWDAIYGPQMKDAARKRAERDRKRGEREAKRQHQRAAEQRAVRQVVKTSSASSDGPRTVRGRSEDSPRTSPVQSVQAIHGRSTDGPRTFHGHSTDGPRTVHGHSTDIPRTVHGQSADCPTPDVDVDVKTLSTNRLSDVSELSSAGAEPNGGNGGGSHANPKEHKTTGGALQHIASLVRAVLAQATLHRRARTRTRDGGSSCSVSESWSR